MAEGTCLAAFVELNTSNKNEIKVLQSERSSALDSTSQSGRRRQLTARAFNEDVLERINNSIVEARVQHRQLKSKYEKLVEKKRMELLRNMIGVG